MRGSWVTVAVPLVAVGGRRNNSSRDESASGVLDPTGERGRVVERGHSKPFAVHPHVQALHPDRTL
jgi:hypothetical protein